MQKPPEYEYAVQTLQETRRLLKERQAQVVRSPARPAKKEADPLFIAAIIVVLFFLAIAVASTGGFRSVPDTLSGRSSSSAASSSYEASDSLSGAVSTPAGTAASPSAVAIPRPDEFLNV